MNLTNSPTDKARNRIYLLRNSFNEKMAMQVEHEMQTQIPTAT